jgi:hypothetical protein
VVLPRSGSAAALRVARPGDADCVFLRILDRRSRSPDDDACGADSRGLQIPAVIVSELVAGGEVELGRVVITQILATPGAELVGPLPAELTVTTKFGGAVSTTSIAPEAANALLQFLRSEEAIKVMRKQAMVPLS